MILYQVEWMEQVVSSSGQPAASDAQPGGHGSACGRLQLAGEEGGQ